MLFFRLSLEGRNFLFRLFSQLTAVCLNLYDGGLLYLFCLGTGLCHNRVGFILQRQNVSTRAIRYPSLKRQHDK